MIKKDELLQKKDRLLARYVKKKKYMDMFPGAQLNSD